MSSSGSCSRLSCTWRFLLHLFTLEYWCWEDESYWCCQLIQCRRTRRRSTSNCLRSVCLGLLHSIDFVALQLIMWRALGSYVSGASAVFLLHGCGVVHHWATWNLPKPISGNLHIFQFRCSSSGQPVAEFVFHTTLPTDRVSVPMWNVEQDFSLHRNLQQKWNSHLEHPCSILHTRITCRRSANARNSFSFPLFYLHTLTILLFLLNLFSHVYFIPWHRYVCNSRIPYIVVFIMTVLWKKCCSTTKILHRFQVLYAHLKFLLLHYSKLSIAYCTVISKLSMWNWTLYISNYPQHFRFSFLTIQRK